MARAQASSQKAAAIISRPARPEVARIVPGLIAWLDEHGYRVIVDPETAKYTNGQPEVIPRAQMSSRPLDLVVVLGSLGFLTEVPFSALYGMLDAISKGQARVEQRSLMHCQLLRGEQVLGTYLVFNDAVVNKTA